MQKIFILLDFKTLENHIYIQNEIYKDLSKNFKLVFIDIQSLGLTQNYKKKNLSKLKKKFKKYSFLILKNFFQFKKYFISNKNSLVIASFRKTFKYFKIFYYIKKYDLKPIVIQNISYLYGGNIDFLETKNFKKLKLKENLIYFINRPLGYFFYRLLILLNIFQQTEFRFISNKEFYRLSKNSKYQKLQNFFKSLKILDFKNTVLINSRSNDRYYKSQKKKILEKYIVFVDSPANHADNVEADGLLNKDELFKYYNSLNIFLTTLGKLFKKKIIICANPKYSLYQTKNYFKNFNVVSKQTHHYVSKAFIVCFLDSSSIIDAIFLKKKIISLNSKVLGNNYYFRNQIYKKKVGLFSHDLEKEFNIKPKILIKKLNIKIKKNYNIFIKNNLTHQKNTKGSFQVIKVLNKYLEKNKN